MANFTPQSRSASSWADTTKHAATYDARERNGLGYFFDDANMFYDQVMAFDSGSEVFYDGDGATISWGNQIRD